jgi:hypothetical protein
MFRYYSISMMREKMFEELEKINERPDPFEFYTASDLWIDEHTSKQMLLFHLNEAIDVSSRNADFINRSTERIASEFKIGRDTKIVDSYSLSAFEQRQEAATYELNQLNGFWSPSRYYGFLNTFKYDEKKVVLDKYTIIEPERTRQVYNWLQYFAPEDLEKEFVKAGFWVKGIYSDVAGNPYNSKSSEFAVIAKTIN